MAKGGASEAATEPPPKQARTPTRRKLDMLAANDAGAREEDAATGETGFRDADASLPGVKHVFRDRLPVETEKRNARARDSEPEETASKTPGSVSARASRERVWSLLLGNVVRAVDEVYFLCEMECGAPEIEGTASLLEACAAEPSNELERMQRSSAHLLFDDTKSSIKGLTLLDENRRENPLYHRHLKIYLPHCSGDGWLGDV